MCWNDLEKKCFVLKLNKKNQQFRDELKKLNLCSSLSGQADRHNV